jgi:hypothetical protein
MEIQVDHYKRRKRRYTAVHNDVKAHKRQTYDHTSKGTIKPDRKTVEINPIQPKNHRSYITLDLKHKEIMHIHKGPLNAFFTKILFSALKTVLYKDAM